MNQFVYSAIAIAIVIPWVIGCFVLLTLVNIKIKTAIKKSKRPTPVVVVRVYRDGDGFRYDVANVGGPSDVVHLSGVIDRAITHYFNGEMLWGDSAIKPT